jgi:S-DNA-T family DNA segregation ATPase FtsK/SpoIIIE
MQDSSSSTAAGVATQPEAAGEQTLREKVSDLGGLIFILGMLFGLVSLISFDAGDVGGGRFPGNETIRNKGGLLGAHLSYFLFRNFGLGGFAVVLLGGFWAFMIFFRHRLSHLALKIVSGGVLVLSLCTILSIQKLVRPVHLGLDQTMVSLGGVYGTAMEMILLPHIGGAGALLFVALLLCISAILATDWMLYRSVLWAGSRTMAWLRDKPSVEPSSPEIVPQRRRPGKPARPEPAPEEEAAEMVPVQTSAIIRKPRPYQQPPIDLFETRVEKIREISAEEIEQVKGAIENALAEYGIEAKVVHHETGPTVTTYEVDPAPGVRIARIAGLAGELSMKLQVPNVRVVAPLPRKGTVGIEVPNPFPNTVRIREFIEGKNYKELRKIPLPLLLGKASSGDTVVQNLSDMPHLLIAGTTGSGKSVCLKAAILSLISAKSPEELKLVLIDPKMVELTAFEDIPHLWAPVITDAKKAAHVLEWLVKEMEDRYTIFNKLHVLKIESFNALGREQVEQRLRDAGMDDDAVARVPEHLPYVVVVIDELADLMYTVGKDVETSIIRLSQKARAVGLHLIAATQRPSADVVTGLIKSNMPARVSFRVLSHIESQIIMDRKGAERLLGKGDMLVFLPGMEVPGRSQCTLVSEEEIRRVVDYLKSLGEPKYRNEILEIDRVDSAEGTVEDDLFEEAVQCVLETRRGSISLLQRRLGIGYQRAARLMEGLENVGIVGAYNGDKPREVLLTPEQWTRMRQQKAENPN